MSKLIILLFVLLCVGSYSYNPLNFQYGNMYAKMMNNYGQIYIPCNGGVGSLNYHYGSLPYNWRQEGNYIMIPNIGVLYGSYIIRVRVQDEDNHVL